MYRNQIEALTARQIRAFTSEQLASFDQMPFLTWITPSQAASMTADQAQVLLGEVGNLDFFHQVKRLVPAVAKALQDMLGNDGRASGEE